MVTLAQRIAELREERGMSRPGLSTALGFPKTAIEKFESGRATPTQDQQTKLADYFAVSAEYLRGETADRTRMGDWMDGTFVDDEPVSVPTPRKAHRPAAVSAPSGGDGNMFDSFLNSKKFQESLRATVLDVLRSAEGQAILSQVVRKEMTRQK